MVRAQLWLVQMLGTFWVGDIVSIYQVGVIHLIKLISDTMSAWEYRAVHETRHLFAACDAPVCAGRIPLELVWDVRMKQRRSITKHSSAC